MGTFGEKLKREREMRAITLEEIAEATKIGTRSLKALEEEHFDLLPGGIFNKGFVRAYAKFLGLDEEQAVADYMTAANEVGNSTTMQMQALADEAERARAANEAAQDSGGIGMMIAVLIGVVVICAIGFGGYKAWKYKKDQAAAEATVPSQRRQAPPPVALQGSAEQTPATNPDGTPGTGTSATETGTLPGAPAIASPATGATSTPANSTTNPPNTGSAPGSTAPATKTPATTSSSSPGASSAEKSAYPIVVTVKATKTSWVSAKSDGKSVYAGQMDPTGKNELSLHASEKLNLVLGNAGGVEVTINGKPAGSLGAIGQARNLNITPQGIQQ